MSFCLSSAHVKANSEALPIGKRSRWLLVLLFLVSIILAVPGWAQNDNENKRISEVVVTFEGDDKNLSAADQFRQMARDAAGETYSSVRVRDAIEQLYGTGRVATVSVETDKGPNDSVVLRFVIKRKTQAQRVSVQIVDADADESKVTEQELLFHLTLLEPGAVVTEQTLRNNADLILEHLREHGYFKAEVTYNQ